METVALVILQVLRLYCTVLYNKYVYVCVVIFVIKLNLGGEKITILQLATNRLN